MFSFGLRVASTREWTEAGIRLVTARLLGGRSSLLAVAATGHQSDGIVRRT